jgi:phosphate starvation-inducible PhoH-like protein
MGKLHHSKAGIKRKCVTDEYGDFTALRHVLGVHDEHIRLIESMYDVEISVRGGTVSIRGKPEDVDRVQYAISQMYEMVRGGHELSLSDVDRIVRLISKDRDVNIAEFLKYSINVPMRNKTIYPRTPAQRAYVEAIEKYDMVFGIGPAGTGKTYLAMAMAVNALMNGQYERIILTRPAVEAGEKLGFLPGDLQEKVNPYLRPLYDALHDMMDIGQAKRLIENDIIEVAPLAFMRGRTLSSSFVILDEAQNCTREQMKMFLTRMGFNSKYVVTGDITQIDLPSNSSSGLIEAIELIKSVNGVYFQYFTEADVVRHRLVRDIVKAYERNGIVK